MRDILFSVPQTIYFGMIHAFTCSVSCEGPAMALGPPAIRCHLMPLALHVLWGNAEKGVSGLREPTLGVLPGNRHGAMHLLHGLGMGGNR